MDARVGVDTYKKLEEAYMQAQCEGDKETEIVLAMLMRNKAYRLGWRS